MRILPTSKFATFSSDRSWGHEAVTVVSPAIDAAFRLQLECGERQIGVELDEMEQAKLMEVMAELKQSYGGNTRANARFFADGGTELHVSYTNWGEPYDQGARFSLGGDDEGFEVRLPSTPLGDLYRHLITIVPHLEPTEKLGPRR